MDSVISIREPDALALVQSLLQQGIVVRIRVSGNSMRPLLQSGDLVDIAPLAGIPRLGDILFFLRKDGTPLVHRLIWQRSQGNSKLLLLTKGDSCSAFDGFIPAEQVLGRVQCIIAACSKKNIDLNRLSWCLSARLLVFRTVASHALRRFFATTAKAMHSKILQD